MRAMATMFFQYEEGNDRDRTMWGESPAEVAKTALQTLQRARTPASGTLAGSTR